MLAISKVVVKEEFYREGFFSGYQRRSRAAKSVSNSQHHHFIVILHLLDL